MRVGWRNRLIRWLGTAVPFEPTKRDLVASARRAVQVVHDGHVLAIAGEGRLSEDEGVVLPIHEGVGFFAIRAGVPIVLCRPAWYALAALRGAGGGPVRAAHRGGRQGRSRQPATGERRGPCGPGGARRPAAADQAAGTVRPVADRPLRRPAMANGPRRRLLSPGPPTGPGAGRGARRSTSSTVRPPARTARSRGQAVLARAAHDHQPRMRVDHVGQRVDVRDHLQPAGHQRRWGRWRCWRRRAAWSCTWPMPMKRSRVLHHAGDDQREGGEEGRAQDDDARRPPTMASGSQPEVDADEDRDE